jgi:glycolate oxidase FAD binding subunit
VQTLAPETFDSFAAELASATASGHAVRIRGGGTKAGWVPSDGHREPSVFLDTRRLNWTVEHTPGDMTAVFAAGVSFSQAQAELAREGQRLALDPPLGDDDGATIGGIVATGDSGPLAHRYGTPRDQVLSVTVALGDGTICRAGSRVIKNVAGYDLPKLYTGSFGTLGAILAVGFRVRALPRATATILGGAPNQQVLASAIARLTSVPLEFEALDVAWRAGRGGVLAQVAGASSLRRADAAARQMKSLGLQGIAVTHEDADFWSRQRGLQRSDTRAVLKLTGPPSALGSVIGLADAHEATVVARAALGISYLTVDEEQVGPLREALPRGFGAVVLDRPAGSVIDTWGQQAGSAMELMRAVKRRFDPAGICNPGAFVGGI